MPQDGVDTLRMLQLFELDHSQVRPHATSHQARPQVPEKFLLCYTCSINQFGNNPRCPAPFGGNFPYIGHDLVLPN